MYNTYEYIFFIVTYAKVRNQSSVIVQKILIRFITKHVLPFQHSGLYHNNHR